MKKGNVLVIGNHGSGKTTLIEAALGEALSKESHGKIGKADELTIYNSGEMPFRLIETAGFEISSNRTSQTVNSIKKWLKDDSKANETDTQIDTIWFCVDGMNKRFIEDFDELAKIANNWDEIPVIVVITQAYSAFDRERNIDSVNNTFAKMKKNTVNLKKVVAVVAENHIFNEMAIAPQEGITELIELTNSIMPEESQIDEFSMAAVKLTKMRMAAQGTVTGATILAVGSGAIKSVADNIIITTMMNNILKNYNLNTSEDAKNLAEQIINIATVGQIAKSIPLLVQKFGAKANIIISGIVTFAVGESAIYMFEQIVTGKERTFDMDTITSIIEKYLSVEIIDTIIKSIKNIADKVDFKKAAQIIIDTLKKIKR